MRKRTLLLNTEYSALSGFYWMLFSVSVSFAVLYLGTHGFTSTQAGFVLAAGNIISLVLQPALGALADKSRKISLTGILLALCVIAGILLAAVSLASPGSFFLAASFTMLLAVVLSIQPLCNSFSFFLEDWGVHINFGVARGIGSLAYAAIAAVLGAVSESTGVVPVIGAGLSVTALMLVSLAVFAAQKRRLGVKTGREAEKSAAAEGSSLLGFIKKYKRFCVFLAAVAFMYFSHSLIVNFMIEAVENVGGGTRDLGLVTALTALVEIPAMFLFDRLCKKIEVRKMLRFAAVMFTVKEVFFFLAGSISGLYIACLFQSLSFAVFIPASVRYAKDAIDECDTVKGQASVTGMCTFGTVFSSFLGGVMFDSLGVSPTLLICALVSAAGTAIALASIPGRKKESNKRKSIEPEGVENKKA